MTLPEKSICDEQGHDWRVDPRLMLTSNPPAQNLQCARCGARSSTGPMGGSGLRFSDDPKDWPKWEQR